MSETSHIRRCSEAYSLAQKSDDAYQRVQDPPMAEIVQLTADEVTKIWQKTSLPVVSNQRVIAMMKSYHTKVQNLLKSLSRGGETALNRKDAFVQEARNTLFDTLFANATRSG